MKYQRPWDKANTARDKLLAYFNYAGRPADMKEITLDVMNPSEVSNPEARERTYRIVLQSVNELLAEGLLVESTEELANGSTYLVYAIKEKAA